MPAPAPKLTDVQETTITIANGGESGYVDITHNLENQSGADLTPDTIIPEIVAITGGAMPARTIYFFLMVRSTPEDGTYRLYLFASNNNISGSNAIFTVRVTSIWQHSIQSSDHTV